MLTDGLKAKDREDIRQLDVVELLEESCAIEKPAKGEPAQEAAAPA